MKTQRTIAVVTQEVFGQSCDFEVKEETDMEAQTATITVTTVLPHVERDGEVLKSYAPPRWPWDGK